MTYKHKLARRLAISRNLAMVNALALLAACAGDTTAPEAPAIPGIPASPSAPLGFRVLPGAVTVEVNQPVRFRGELQSFRGQVFSPPLAWEASGGQIDSSGTFHAGRPGTYRIVGRGKHAGRNHPQRPDTSIVIVVPRQPQLLSIRVTPRGPRLDAGEERSFKVVGRLNDGSTPPIGVVWTATGGTIDPSGVFRAGHRSGTFKVVATNTAGTLSDTVRVKVVEAEVADTTPSPNPDPTPEPEPEPEPEPTPTLGQVVLKPASVALATNAVHQFAAFGRTTAGDSVVVDVTYRATGGTITSTGLFTAGPSAGSYRVIASSDDLADTAMVTLTRAIGGGTGPFAAGIPYGVYSAWEGTNYKANTDVFGLSIGTYTSDDILRRLEVARAGKKQLILAMAGGKHEQYKTNGVFDYSKWRARMETYNTPAIRAAIAAGVVDGTIIGNSVMDEPHNTAPDNSWGPAGTVTKARVDEMCGYVKAMFPTLPAGVVHPHDVLEPTRSYQNCDFIVAQYSHRKTKGDIEKFRDEALAMGRQNGIAIAFSLNILDGGVQSERNAGWNCGPDTGGRGTYDPNCRMTPQQVREWGILLGSAGCALTMWRYDASFMGKPENQAAFRDVRTKLSTLPGKACRRS